MSSGAEHAALDHRRWHEARDALAELAEQRKASAADLDALANAAHAVGDYELALQALQDAHAGYVELGDREGAAATAVRLVNTYIRRGELALCAGWLATAEQLVANQPESAALGLVRWTQTMFAIVLHRDFDAARTLADETGAIGERTGDRDVQALALALLAEIEAKSGDAQRGLKLVDEAMARAVGGRLSPWASCHILCRSLIVCQDTGDANRGRQWVDAARAVCEREGMTPLSGDCRVHHAGLLNQQGNWVAAEHEAHAGCAELVNDVLHLGLASYELGELALHRGDYAMADSEFQRAHEFGRPPQPGLALLRLAQGRGQAAASMIATALADEVVAAQRARLLAAEVEIALANGDLETASNAAAQLGGLSLATESLVALSETCAGAVALARGDDDAAAFLRAAARRWAHTGMPYQAARARVLLAECYVAGGDIDSAELELRSAHSTFENLGAQPDAKATRAALRRVRPDEAPGQRVTRAFMFTDIVGSTPLVEALGDEAWGDLLRWHDRCLRAEFSAHRGREVDNAGDGFFVAFSSADDALRCAGAIQRKLREHRRANGFAPQVRIGVHVDDATDDGAGYQGLGVHTAARIGAEAQAGEVLASRATLAAAGDAFDTGEPRMASLKGIAGPVELVPVSWD